jgi:hypothetical protein
VHPADGYGLSSAALSVIAGVGLPTSGVAQATQTPTVGNPCSGDRDVLKYLLSSRLATGRHEFDAMRKVLHRK